MALPAFVARLLPTRHKNGIFHFISYVPKRLRVIIATITMLLLFTTSSFFSFTNSWYIFVLVITLASFITTFFAIYEDITGDEWYMLFIMPIFFALSLYLFYSLLPVRWLTRLPFLVLLSFGYYAMLLTSNIFNIGVEKSIQLYRAAFSINYLAQSFIIFLVTLVTISFRFNFLLNGMLVGGISYLLSLQLFWSVKLDKGFDVRLLKLSGVVGLIMFELALLLSFVPMRLNVV
ncbi:hypothetical protein KBD81_00115, partial [Candidatus Woesebacteria bacterium]|nr:hypothetical protein [Candidatus Woesebacteria bacterium]